MARCLLAFGANLGDREQSLDKALELIVATTGSRLLARSTWHQTAAVGGPAGQADFLNGAVLVDASLSPLPLANALRMIEEQLGRERKIRWDARTLDLDILLYDDQVIDEVELQIPHPRMAYRQFVLAPAAEIAGHMLHPILGWTIAALLNYWRAAPRTVAVAGPQTELSQSLRKAILEELNYQARARRDSQTIELVSMDEKPSMILDIGAAVGPIRLVRPISPIVSIEAIDPETVLRETIAAIQAAWPV